MKLVIAVVHDYDADRLLGELTAKGFGATKVLSEGGFLRLSNVTVLAGVPDDAVAEVLRLIAKAGGRRVDAPLDEAAAALIDGDFGTLSPSYSGGGVAFVARVDRFERVNVRDE